MIEWKSRTFLLNIISLQLIVDVFIFLDVPIARQIVGFVSLTFIPGSIILKLLRFDDLDMVETILFSIGFSIAYLMLGGLLINVFGSTANISQPLSLIPLLVFWNVSIFLSTFWLYFREVHSTKPYKLSLFMLLSFAFPILSIIGAMCVNIFVNNLILLIVFILVTLLFVMNVFFNRPESKFPFAFAIFIIAISILYHASLISNYIVPFGSDLPGEYFLHKTTQVKAYWSSFPPFIGDIAYGRINAMLSVTILPTIYSTLLKMDSAWIYKLVFPSIFAFVPVGLFHIWQTQVGKKYAFIAAFLFMAQFTFYTEMLGLSRQMIAEIFFVLLLLITLNGKFKPFSKAICFVTFGFALITSHYAIAEIFLFFAFCAYISLIVPKRRSQNITFSMVVFFSVMMFAWYIFTSRATTFDSILAYGDYVYQQLDEFFNPASRGQIVMTGLGMVESPSLWNTLSRIFTYIIQAFIVFGFIGLITKRAKIRMKNEFFVFCVIAMIFLFMLILIPGLANTMNMTRFYHILLFFLAPLCPLGIDFLSRLMIRKNATIWTLIILTAVLVPQFLFQSGFIYELTGADSWSIPLSGYRMNAFRLYGHYGFADVYSVSGAQWLSEKFHIENLKLYADERTLTNILTIYCLIPRCNLLSNITNVADDGVIYLSKLNVIYELIPSENFLWNSSQLSYVFDELNIIYNNGGSEVYKNMS